MSSGLSTIITDVTAYGLQSGARYSAVVGGWTIPSSYIISVSIPGPKFELLNINYWEANMYTRVPVGVKIEDPLILNVLIPTANLLETSIGNYVTTHFTQMNGGVYFGTPGANSYSNFTQIKAGAGNGIGISISAYDNADVLVRTYSYYNCFLERILPMKMAADEPQPVYATFVYAVGYMGVPPSS